MQKRTKQIIIRVNGDEHARMKLRAGKMRLAAFLRTAALDRIPPVIPQINRDALAELHRIGSNLNQLARVANTHSRIELDDLCQQTAALRIALMECLECRQ